MVFRKCRRSATKTLLVQIFKWNISIALHVITENSLSNYHFPISERHTVASPLNTSKRYFIICVFVKLCFHLRVSLSVLKKKGKKTPMCFTSTTDSPITERSGSSIDRSWIPFNQEKNFHCDMSGCNIGRELLNVSNAISLFLLSSLNCRKKLKCGKSNVRFSYISVAEKFIEIYDKTNFNVCLYYWSFSKIDLNFDAFIDKIIRNNLDLYHEISDFY